MSQSVELKAAAVVVEAVVVKKIKIKSKPAVVKVPEKVHVPENSIWMHMRRIPKEKPEPIVWENVEDISDDENDTPQAAGKRLSTMKATRDRMQRRAYEKQLEELQGAGLFLTWSRPRPWQTHSNYSFSVQSTAAYPLINV